jgi:shikimate kinase
MEPIIILCGLRGSGKSTLGRLLAVRLGCSFVDLDDRVRAALHAPHIATAFRQAGEAAFRAAECKALAETLGELGRGGSRAVLALGGGTPTHAASRELLEAARERGEARVILLDAAPAVLGARVAASPGDRPLLAGTNFAEEAKLLSERRLPAYRKLSHAVVRTDVPTDEALRCLESAAGK